MKRRVIRNVWLITIVIAAIGYSACQPPTSEPNINAGPSPTPTSEPTANPDDKGVNPDDKGALQEVVASEAMIIRVEKDVRLKFKGATEFIHILYGLFRDGDTLQVGDQSKAWISCQDRRSLCPLSTGVYSECCRGGCAGGIQITPPANSESQNRVALIAKSQLPPGERQTLELLETRIRQLGANQVTTQFLIADLYSSWKLVEANDELKDLTEKLDRTETQKELKLLYGPMLRQTGNMQLRVNQKDKAETTYKKAVEVAPKLNDPREKAAAHVALADHYEKVGQNEKAVMNLEKSEQLFKKDGDATKAAAARRAIVRIKKP